MLARRKSGSVAFMPASARSKLAIALFGSFEFRALVPASVRLLGSLAPQAVRRARRRGAERIGKSMGLNGIECTRPDSSARGTPRTLRLEYDRRAIGVLRDVRESKVTVKIPRPLYRKIQHVVEGSGFNSPTDFIVFVLRDLMGDAEQQGASELSKNEIDDLKRKLKKLGYL